MKKKITFFCFVFYGCIVLAQNQRPSINNVLLTNNKENERLEIVFDLDDPEDKHLRVNVDLYDENDVLLKGIVLSGAIGDSIIVGKKKIIYCDYPESLKSSESVSISITANDYHPVHIQDLIEQVNVDNLKRDLEFVEGRRFPITLKDAEHHKEVRKFITDNFVESGLQVFEQDSLMNSFNVKNIIGEKQGLKNANSSYILCAHYDAYFKSPGADDNASGVAGMLEAMRILSKYNFDRSIRFIGFDMEEDDLLGSTAYTSGQYQDKNEIDGVVNLDMIGYFSEKPNSQLVPDGFNKLFPIAYEKVASNNFKGDFVVINYIESSADLKNTFKESISKYTPSLKNVSLDAAVTGELNSELSASDHLSFWKVGVKAIHIGDGGASRNIYINTKKDRLKLINYEYMKYVVKATIAAIAELAGLNNLSSYQGQINMDVK